MAIEETKYVLYPEAVQLHLELMWGWDELRCGVADRPLVESALARPQQAAAYENADLLRQAATLYFGLIKNHPWVGGNKRTATAIVDEFLDRNGMEVNASMADILHLVLAIEADLSGVDEIEAWLRDHTTPLH